MQRIHEKKIARVTVSEYSAKPYIKIQDTLDLDQTEMMCDESVPCWTIDKM